MIAIPPVLLYTYLDYLFYKDIEHGESMKRKLLITISIIATLALCVGIFAGCTESQKQDAIATEYSTAISGNGGMTVVYGKYLYFINGYAGETADNTFGEVVKGAVARVELVDGKPSGDAQIIVPKNVYGTDTNYGGIYIVNDYIYYATTSTDLDGNGDAKTGKSVLMRTKVDGTDTTEIAKFDDHSVVFKVVGNNLVYIRSNAVYSINLSGNKFAAATVEDTIASGYLFTEDYLYYNVYAEEGDSTDYVMKAYDLNSGEKKELLSAEKYGKEDVKYTFTILSAITEGNNVRIFYNKVDDTQGNPEVGIYSCVFDKATFAYSAENEKRLTLNATSVTDLNYTKFYKAGNYYLGYASKKLDAFNADGTRVAGITGIESLNVGAAITVFDVEETADKVVLWYLDSNSVLRKIDVLNKVGETWTFVQGNETQIFNGKADKTYVGMEKVGDVLYFFNGNVSNNAYYYVIEGEKPSEGKAKILGQIIESDVIAAF